MTTEDLLQELKIRFNTSPKLYEKGDFNVLLKTLNNLNSELNSLKSTSQSLQSNITNILSAILSLNSLQSTLNSQIAELTLTIAGAPSRYPLTTHSVTNHILTYSTGATVNNHKLSL